ncbi:hypothetical protein HYALB_00013746 [Hymenoscyphus albidus]|uniref:Rhodopsin domain-containing protein n=1 Tax=Hymenoscyphus albidus TaxID=595503 RepID=A0A9N9QAW9_9HELO|nr:hypothetical protein HYALB_00013746 [Hymenoscyphus albidus]
MSPNGSNARQVQIPAVVFLVLCPLIVAIRFWGHTRGSVNHLGIDDWTILGSLAFAIVVSALMLASCDYGFGKHIATLSPTEKKMTLKLFYVAQAFYKLNINLTKCSILLLYLRIFVQRPFRILCWILLAIVPTYGIASTSASIWQCNPIPRAWDKTIQGSCINITASWFANAGFSIVTDIIILALPMPLVYSLKLEKPHKVALALVFALGGFVVVTSVLRSTTLHFSSTSMDTTYDIASSIWTIIESNIGIICACLPICKIPFRGIITAIFPMNGRSQISGEESYYATSSHAGKKEWTSKSAPSTDVELGKLSPQRCESEERILHNFEYRGKT